MSTSRKKSGVTAQQDKAVVLFASKCILWNGKTHQNNVSAVFKRWRHWLRSVHPDRQAGRGMTHTQSTIFGIAQKSDVTKVRESDVKLQKCIFVLAKLAALGLFNGKPDLEFENTKDVIRIITGWIRAYKLRSDISKAKTEHLTAASKILNKASATLSPDMLTEFNRWHRLGSKSRSKSRSTSSTKSLSQSKRHTTIAQRPLLLLPAPLRSKSSAARTPRVPRSKKTKLTRGQYAAINRKKPCPDRSKVRHPGTRRCRISKPCPPGQLRDVLTSRCRTTKRLKPCASDKVRDRYTHRCRKA